MLSSQQYFKFMYYKEICCEICFLPEDRGQQWLKFTSVKEPLPDPQRDSARDNTGETILTSARYPTPAHPACTKTQAQARQTGERSYANIGQLDCCAYVLYPYTFFSTARIIMPPFARVKHENIYNVGHLISRFSSVKAVCLLLLFWITICCVSILITFYVTY